MEDTNNENSMRHKTEYFLVVDILFSLIFQLQKNIETITDGKMNYF